MGRRTRTGRTTTAIATAVAVAGAMLVLHPAGVGAGGPPAAESDHPIHVITIEPGAAGEVVTAPPAPFPYDQTFQLHSKPDSSKVIHLDFDGFTSPEGAGTTIFGEPLNDVTYLPYDLDGDGTTWSDAELDVVQEVWLRVSEAYAPWDVDVTTEEPSDDDLYRDPDDPLGDTTWGVRTLITNSTDGGLLTGCGSCIGIAWTGVFGSLGVELTTPASATLPQRFGGGRAADTKILATTIIHEIGHNLGLGHDVDATPTSVFSAMMAPNYQATPLMPFTPATEDFTLEDFFRFGVELRPDDHGDDAAAATPLLGTEFDAEGIVAFGGDEDWFSVTATDGDTLDLAVTTSPFSYMLDVDAALFDDQGQLVEASNPPAVAVSTDVADGLDATFDDLTLPAGTYTLRVRGSGGDGYSPYGSIGSYSVTGSIVSPATPCPPGSFSATGVEPCEPAPGGFFVPDVGATAATPCPPGTFSAVAGAVACTDAPAGAFVDIEGATAAMRCPPGTFSAVTGAVECTLAPIGSFVPDEGATEATPCPPGTTTTAPGALACEVIDSTPPVIVAEVAGGTLGSNGWYVAGPVSVQWLTADEESPVTSPPCDVLEIATDTAGVTSTCTATSDGGTSTDSVTIQLDSTDPVVEFVGNSGRYDILSEVAIDCMASDALSGLASDTCTDVRAPAWTFGAGTQSLSATATDHAGNSAEGTTEFQVVATTDDLCALTRRLVEGSEDYGELRWWGRLLVDVVVESGCSRLAWISPDQSDWLNARLLRSYTRNADWLQRVGVLSPDEATALRELATTL